MRKTENILVLVTLFLTMCIRTSAAVMVPDPSPYPDHLSLDAMIHNHRTVGAAALTRTTNETGNYEMHKEDSRQENKYKEVETKLDFYNRALNVYGLILEGVQTGFHTYTTINNVKDGLKGYYDLVEEYNTKILAKGAIWSTDIQIIDLTGKLVTDLEDEMNQLWKDMVSLAEYGTGIRECKTDVLMCILGYINDDLDAINKSVRECYNDLFRYMSFRLGYWKKEIVGARDLHDMAHDAALWAIERWKNSANRSKANASTGSYDVTLGHGALLGHGG